MASASKAMVEACYRLPRLMDKVKEQSGTISMLEFELNSLRELLRRKMEADEVLINAIKKR